MTHSPRLGSHPVTARWLSALLLACAVAACSSESTEDDDGGSSSTGGVTGVGGAASGGAASGGVTGVGGVTGTGAVGSGGTGGSDLPSTGGVVGTGGIGTGGVGTGGVVGTGGAATGGAGTGGTAAGGSGGTAGFDPCPATEPCKVLPLGDSITEGMTGSGSNYSFNGGYRVELFRLAHSNGKNMTFVGTRSNGPDTVDGAPFPKNNEGYSGIKIQALNDQHIPGKLAGAHIVLLHIGTNDMTAPANAPAQLEALIDEITDALPNSLLVVSNIIPFSLAASATTTYNAAIPGIVDEKAAAGAHVIFVDQNTGFPTNQLPDQIHPNAAGYAVMGTVWYDAIKSYLH